MLRNAPEAALKQNLGQFGCPATLLLGSILFPLLETVRGIFFGFGRVSAGRRGLERWPIRTAGISAF